MSDHPLLSRYLEQIYNTHSRLPQHVDISDFKLLSSPHDLLDHNKNLNYKDLKSCLL